MITTIILKCTKLPVKNPLKFYEPLLLNPTNFDLREILCLLTSTAFLPTNGTASLKKIWCGWGRIGRARNLRLNGIKNGEMAIFDEAMRSTKREKSAIGESKQKRQISYFSNAFRAKRRQLLSQFGTNGWSLPVSAVMSAKYPESSTWITHIYSFYS